MKRFIAVVMLLSILCTTALAEMDVQSMTDQDLQQTINQCAEELRKRNTDESGTLIFEQEGLRLYQVGDAYIDKSGRIKVPVIGYSEIDARISVTPSIVACNGFTVQGYGLTYISPKSAMIGELDFATGDLKLESLDDVFSLIMTFSLYSPELGSVYGGGDRIEYRFW